MNQKFFLLALLKLGSAAALSSCSVIASITNSEQCRVDGDCFKFPGYACDVKDHVCVRSESAEISDASGASEPSRSPDAAFDAKDLGSAVDADGDPWACLGHVVNEPVSKPKPTLTLALREVTNVNQGVSANIEVTGCAKLDTACSAPFAQAVPNAAGDVAFTVDAGFAGFFEIKSTANPPVYPPYLFFVNPPVNGDRTNLVPLVSISNYAGLVAQVAAGGSLDPSLGSVVFWAQDCVGGLAKGVSATIDGTSVPVEGGPPTGTRFYLADGLPSLSLTATDSSGAGGFLNVVPGTHVITAIRQQGGAAIARISMLTRPGTLTFASLPPLP